MTFGALLAVAAARAATTEGARALYPSGGTVAGVLEDYDGLCWAHHCDVQLSACTSLESACSRHFDCGRDIAVFGTPAMRECFGDTRWQELSERELGLFACARENACVSEDHPVLSFLEEEMRRRGMEEGTLDLSEEQSSTVSVVLRLHAMLQMAQDRLARITTTNAITDLKAATQRLAKLQQINQPTTQDMVTMAAVERRLRSLDGRIGELQRAANARVEAPPLNITAIAKMAPQDAIASYSATLSETLDQLKAASFQPSRGERRAAAEKFALDQARLSQDEDVQRNPDGVALAKMLMQQAAARTQTLAADAHLRAD